MGDDRPPVFVDLYGTGRPDDDEPLEPMFRRCWYGREKLWVVFWAYGMFGCGVVIASWLACIFIGLQLGLLIEPVNTDGGLVGAIIGIGLGACIGVPFLVWMTVSLWRCAPNCANPLWGRLVRGWLIAQYLGFAMLACNYSNEINL